jgi:hypothetical protein
MNSLLHFGAIVATAIGAGLVAFSGHLDPARTAANPASFAQPFDLNDHHAASAATGFGTALITFGVLLLIIPWVNRYLSTAATRPGTIRDSAG